MKITKKLLKEIIEEEISRVLKEVRCSDPKCKQEIQGTKPFAAERKDTICAFAKKVKDSGGRLEDFSTGILFGYHITWKTGLEKTDSRLKKASNVQNLSLFCASKKS